MNNVSNVNKNPQNVANVNYIEYVSSSHGEAMVVVAIVIFCYSFCSACLCIFFLVIWYDAWHDTPILNKSK
jgi:hypothetical protein